MENLENKKKYEQLKKMEKKYELISILFLIPSWIFGLIEFALFIGFIGDNPESSSPLLVLNSIIFIPLIIAYFYFKKKIPTDEIRRYCPYCYEKDFKRTTLSEECIRVYNKQEKRKVGSGHDKREIHVPVRVEEWKGKYRNECCGKEYENTWEHRIDLRD